MYYVQEFRVSCVSEDYSAVLEFLRTDEYKIRNILIKDIQLQVYVPQNTTQFSIIHILCHKYISWTIIGFLERFSL